MGADCGNEKRNRLHQSSTDDTLRDHEERITENERFRLRMQGAITVIAFALGGGAVTTLLLYSIGLV